MQWLGRARICEGTREFCAASSAPTAVLGRAAAVACPRPRRLESTDRLPAEPIPRDEPLPEAEPAATGISAPCAVRMRRRTAPSDRSGQRAPLELTKPAHRCVGGRRGRKYPCSTRRRATGQARTLFVEFGVDRMQRRTASQLADARHQRGRLLATARLLPLRRPDARPLNKLAAVVRHFEPAKNALWPTAEPFLAVNAGL